MTKHVLFVVVLLATGCASSSTGSIQAALDAYETVDFENGVDLSEAKIIARRELIKNNVADLYQFTKPLVDKDVEELPHHEDYWFIYFEEKRPGSIPFIFMVVVNKGNGRVKFADDYNEGNRWILEAALLR